MHIDLHRAYRSPVAIIRVENAAQGEKAGLEIVTHVHEEIGDPNASLQSPAFKRHELHNAKKGDARKLDSIRVRVEFDNPAHVLRAAFVKWSDTELDHPVCTGNGKVANQTLADKTEVKRRCLGPSRCPIANNGSSPCVIDVRLNATLDEMPIEIRSNSQNGFLAMLSGLEYAQAKANGMLNAALLDVTVWEKSTRGSKYQPFTTIDIRYAGIAPGAKPSSAAMNTYGDKLLGEWESKFHRAGVDLDALPLPVEQTIVGSKHVQSRTKTLPVPAGMESLFNLPALIGFNRQEHVTTA
ncbi:hypothetical protein V8Z74_14895 [Comamonas sp. w2-DMI]|uniref:recombination directionality factor n=1 Tax=Comamonas sp. w2-DMI TaxID=3126391 RepID=UPI0032E41CC6